MPPVSKSRATLVSVALLCVAAVAPGARATLMPTFALSGLVHEAHAVVRGQVIDEEVVYDARFRRVYTHSVVRVEETLSGAAAPGDVIVVRQVGGLLDGVHSQVVGTARLDLGDEVVLFARTDGAYHYLIGMAQGLFRIERGPGGATEVLRSTHAMRLVASPLPGAAPPVQRQRWETLRANVLAVLAEVGR